MTVDKHSTKKARQELAQDMEEHLIAAVSELPLLWAMVQLVLDGTAGLAADAESDDERALPPSLEDEVGRAAVWLLCAGKEAFEQDIAIMTEASASGLLLADALERFLFASVRLHGADVRELTARLSSCRRGSDEGPWDSALLYATTPEAKLRCWVRRLLNAGWVDAIAECRRLLRPSYGPDGVTNDSAVCEVVRDVKACLERLSRHGKPVPPMLLPCDTPELLVEPLETCNLGLGSTYGGAGTAAAVVVEGAGMRQANGVYLPDIRHANATTFVHRSGGFKLILETRTGCSLGYLPYMGWDLCQAPSRRVLYTARAHSMSSHMPPAHGWRVGLSGRPPCPRLRIARLEECMDTTATAGPGEPPISRGASLWPTAAGTVSTPHTISSRVTGGAPCWTTDSPPCTEQNRSTRCVSSMRREKRRRCRTAAIDVRTYGADEVWHVGGPLSGGKEFDSSLCGRLRLDTDNKLPSPQHTSSTSPRAMEEPPSFASEIRGFEDHLGDGRSQRLQRLYAETSDLQRGEELLLKAKLETLASNQESDGCDFSAAAHVRQVQRDIEMEADREADSHIQQPQQCTDDSASLNHLVERLSQERRESKQRDRVAECEMHNEDDDRPIDSRTADIDISEEDGPEADVQGKPRGMDLDAVEMSPSTADVVLPTKLEVVDVEVERTGSSSTPALLYLIRVTTSEVDSDAVPAGPASLSPRTTTAWSPPPPLRHRVRTLRKQLSSIVALHSDLQALLLTATETRSAANRRPCVNSCGHFWSSATLPPVLNAQELVAFEDAYIKRHGDPLPSFSLMHTADLRSSTRRALSVVERYLSGVISLHKNLPCAGGGTAAESKRPMKDLAHGVWSALQRFMTSSDGSGAVDDIVLSWSMEQPPSTQTVDAWSREEVLKKQGGQCRACGVALASSFLGMDTQYMLCRYTGAVYCTQRCGGEDKAALPWDVVTRWDFTRKAVCKLAAAYLREIADRPVVRLTAMEAGAAAQGDVLKHVGNLRDQLRDYKSAVYKAGCPQGQGLLQAVEQSRPHLVHERDLFSMTDLVELKDRQLTEGLADLVEALHEHVVEECPFCKTKGCSTCGICRHTEPLFPHQTWKVSLCDACGATFHKACVRGMQMPLQCPFCHGLGPSIGADDHTGNVKMREADEGIPTKEGFQVEGSPSRVKALSRDVVMRGTFEAVAAAATAACPAPPRVSLKNNLEAGPPLHGNKRSAVTQQPPSLGETILTKPQVDEPPLGADNPDSVCASNAAEHVMYNNVPISTEDLEFSFM